MAQEKTNVTNETEELSAEKVNEIFQVRRDKLAALKENGKNPFEEVKYDVTATSAQIVAEYKDENDEISEEDPSKSKVWYIGDDTIEEVIIPEGVETIGPFAFANLTALRKVTLPSTLSVGTYRARFKVDNVDGALGDDIHIRFESIIEFPYFLLHALRVFVDFYNVSLKKDLGELLDDKKLIADFETFGPKNEVYLDPGQAVVFKLQFIVHLLQTRYLFDMFIIKREFTGEDKEGEWSLKELHTSGQASKKKAYYSNTKLKYEKEWETTYAPRNKECLMIQSALRVSYTSPKVMHWITELVLWLFKNDEVALLTNEAEGIAALATKENFLDEKDYKLGVTTPHIVFNFLDYLLWKNNKNKYSNFEFEFRNSVEHWYPQNPSDGSFDSWDDKDTFGNLCIISRSVNSKFSNLSPESKMKSYGKMVEKGSLKLRLMGEIIQQKSNDDWIENYCKKHEEKMISILENACRKIM